MPALDLITPAEAAAMFGVDRKTIGRWGDSGRLRVYRTLGGHRRYVRDEVAALALEHQQPREEEGS